MKKRLFAWIILGLTTALWIAAGFGAVAQDEPRFVLHLSFAAIWITAIDSVWVAKIEENHKEEQDNA